MNKKEILKDLQTRLSEILNMEQISKSISTCECFVKKGHKMFYSHKTGTFCCPTCEIANASLKTLTEISMGRSLTEEEFLSRVFQKYMKNEKDEYLQVIKDEAENEKIRKESLLKINEDAFLIFKKYLSKNKKALKYLYGRGFTDEDIEKYHIGYSPNSNVMLKELGEKYSTKDLLYLGLIIENKENKGEYYDAFRNRIIFSLFDDDGNLIGFSGRVFGDNNSSSKYYNSKASSLFVKNEVLYNLNNVKDKKFQQLFVCEGFMDAIAMDKNGINNVVATMGTAFTRQNAEKLKKISPNITIMYDGDEPGINAANKAMEKIFANLLILPEGKDPDEILKEKGKEFLLKYIDENSIPWHRWKLEQMMSEETKNKKKKDA